MDLVTGNVVMVIVIASMVVLLSTMATAMVMVAMAVW